MDQKSFKNCFERKDYCSRPLKSSRTECISHILNDKELVGLILEGILKDKN